ncbi:MAG: hypothetical protein ACRD0Q_06915 [Acidimicrobiales bacterium]
MGPLVAVAVFAAGAAVVVAVFLSAISTVVVPRGVPVRLSRIVFLGVRRVFEIRTRFAHSYEERDRAMALYAPLSLISLPLVWLALVMGGYAAMFWALGVHSVRSAFVTSGSSLLTLGFAPVHDLPSTVLAFTEASVGLVLVALLITYLPSMYASFSRRETLVTLNAIQAGSPPSAVELLERFQQLAHLDVLDDQVWQPWTNWFLEVEETHTSLSALVFFRSPSPQRSWITAAGVVLDAGSLYSSAIDRPRSPQAELCIRSGYLALRSIADFFDIAHDHEPAPGDPISVSRDEFDAACDRLAAAGVPVVADRDQGWADFVGWRVNYDTVLIALAAFTVAPYAAWSSDRSPLRTHRPRVRRNGRAR